MGNNPVLSGSGIAVLIGVILFISCWWLPTSIGNKIFLALIGAASFGLGLKFSKG